MIRIRPSWAACLAVAALSLSLLAPGRPWTAQARSQETDVCATLQSGTIADGTVWTPAGSPYMVNCDVRVANTASSLTIQSGVEVRFLTGKGMRVDGPLTIEGSAPDAVIFTSQQANPQPGDWRGIDLETAEVPATINGLTLRFAGQPSSPSVAALRMRRDNTTLTNLTVEDSSGIGVAVERISTATFEGLRARRNVSAGLDITDSTQQAMAITLRNSVFEGNAEAVRTGSNVDLTLGGNAAHGNKLNGILFKGSRVSRPMTWPGGDLPYVIDTSMSVEGLLTLEPGTVIKFSRPGSSMRVASKGVLSSKGSAEKRILFTSLADDSACSSPNVDCDTGGDGMVQPGPGNWGVLEIGTDSADGSVIDQTVLRYGGGALTAMLDIKRNGTVVSNSTVAFSGASGIKVSNVSASISDCTVSGNKDDGIRIDTPSPVKDTDNRVQVLRCGFERNGGAAVSAHPNVALEQSGNRISGPGLEAFSNGINGILLVDGDINRPISWTAGTLPYVFAQRASIAVIRGAVKDAENRTLQSKLTIEPGAVIKLGSEASLANQDGQMQIGPAIDADGLFDASGPAVLITSVLDDACDAQDTARGCDTGHDGASDARPGSWVQVDMRGSGRSTMADAVVRYGGSLTDQQAAVVIRHDKDEVRGSEIAFSQGYGIKVDKTSVAFISDCDIHDNGRGGIQGTASASLALKLFLSGNKIHDNPGPAIGIDANATVVRDTIDRVAGSTVNPAKDNLLSGNAIDGIAITGDLSFDRTWEPVGLNYVIMDNVDIGIGKTLTIKPGVQIRFKGTSLVSQAGSRIIAEGTEAEPIVFTSLYEGGGSIQPGPGDWSGLQLNGCIASNDPSTCSRLKYVKVRYAGSSGSTQSATIKVTANGVAIDHAEISLGTGAGVLFENATGALTNSVIRKMGLDGVVIKVTGTNLSTPDLSNLRVEECASILHMDANAQPIVTGLSYADNRMNGLVVDGTISRQGPVRWGRAAAPYIIGSNSFTVGTNATLLIDAGTVVKSDAGRGLSVARNGALTAPAPGSGADPIILTSLRDDSACAIADAQSPNREDSCDTNNDGNLSRPGPGDWIGIEYVSQATSMQLDHVTVDYAGLRGQALRIEAERAVIKNSKIRWSQGNGVLVLPPSNVSGDPLQFSGNLVEGCLGTGMVLNSQWQPVSYKIVIENNRFIRNARSIEHKAKGPTEFRNNVAIGNGQDAMLYCAEIATGQVWSRDLVREMDCTLSIKQQLKLEAGTVLRLRDVSEVRVDGAGKLDAEGVVLTAANDGAGPGYWGSVIFARGNTGGGSIRHSLVLNSGKNSGGAVSIQSDGPVDVLYNMFLRTANTGVDVGASRNDKVMIAGNLFNEIAGASSTSVVRLASQARPSILNNRMVGAAAGISSRDDAQPKIEGNSFGQIANFGVENSDTDTCVEVMRQWWGDPSGPKDPRKGVRDACGPDIINESGKGAPASDGVRYLPWLTTAPPAAPQLQSPQCGVTNQGRVDVVGNTSPEALVQVFDNDQPVGQPIPAGSDGRFSFDMTLADGAHALSFEARASQKLSDGTSYDAVSPRSGYRRIAVDSQSKVDPMGLRFIYGGPSSPRAQRLRDVTGCSVGCGGFSGGRVTLPPNTEVRVAVPVKAGAAKVTFSQPGRPEVALAIDPASGDWMTPPIQPVQDIYDIVVDGQTAGPCSGFIYLGETGVIFSDTGIDADPEFSEDFESGLLTEWVTSAPTTGSPPPPPSTWAIVAADPAEGSRGGKFMITDSPDGNYRPRGDSWITNARTIDLSGIPAPQLRFWHNYRLASGDSAVVEVKSANDIGWTALKDSRFQNVSGGWKAETFPLDAYAGLTQFQIRFRLTTDSSREDDGWSIDNISIGPGGRDNGRFDHGIAGSKLGEPVVDDAVVTLRQRNPGTGEWRDWVPPVGGGQVNPQNTDDFGRYGFYGLEPGEYRVVAVSNKFGVRVTDIVAVWDGVFAREIPMLAGEPLYLPSLRKGTQ